MNQDSMEKFKEELAEIYHLSAALSVLNWDQDVNMPKKGAELRAKAISNLAGILHDKFVSASFSRLVRAAKKEADAGKLGDDDACIVREVWREFSREKKLPLEFVKELSETTSVASSVWAEARKRNDFKLFLPYLKKIVELKRKEAELIEFKDSPYDALLDGYEPGMTARELEMIFSELRDFLVPFLSCIMKSKAKVRNILKGKFPVEKQAKFNRMVAEKLGFDFEAGRLDISTHPFTTHFHPGDVRITTRYSDKDPFYSIGSTVHESGHALYEQGIPMGNFGSPLGDSVSLGIHESQSRMWENVVGKSEDFWKYFFPRLKRIFPENFAKTEIKDVYGYVNTVKPSLIRTEADEVTYNLHIIMRFEIEKDLVEGSIAVEDLPKIWNSKVKEYFGIEVPSDTLGVLQDVHWSGGLIGYFPTYALGNLYSAQFYAAARRDILNLDREIRAGQFTHLLNWLRKNIHVHGKLFSADSLVMNVTGERLNAKYFMDYVREKYSKIYGL